MILYFIYFDLCFYFILISSDFTLFLHVAKERNRKKEQGSDLKPLQSGSRLSFASVLDRISSKFMCW